MPLTWRNATLHMEWCLDCHRHPEDHLRPPNAVLAMGWKRGDQSVSESQTRPEPARTDCSACHR
jgi:hypothetical protein